MKHSRFRRKILRFVSMVETFRTGKNEYLHCHMLLARSLVCMILRTSLKHSRRKVLEALTELVELHKKPVTKSIISMSYLCIKQGLDILFTVGLKSCTSPVLLMLHFGLKLCGRS